MAEMVLVRGATGWSQLVLPAAKVAIHRPFCRTGLSAAQLIVVAETEKYYTHSFFIGVVVVVFAVFKC